MLSRHPRSIVVLHFQIISARCTSKVQDKMLHLPPPWQELLEEFVADEDDLSEKTRDWYRQWLCNFFLSLPQEVTEPHQITLRHIKRFRSQLKASKCTWSTKNGTHTALDVFFSWLKREGLIAFNIFAEAKLKRPKRPRRVNRTIPMRHIERIIKAARDAEHFRDAAMMRVLIKTGVRREELTRMKLSDLDMVDREIVVVGKFKHERYVFLDEMTIRAILAWLAARPQTRAETVFVTELRGSGGGFDTGEKVCHQPPIGVQL